MPRQKAPRQKMMNPLAGAGGGAPNQQFLGIGNPNGAQINFNNDELEAELNDLLGEDRPKAAQPAKKAPKKLMPWDQLGSMIDDCMVDVDDVDDDLDDADFEDELAGMISEEEVEEPPPKAPSPVKKAAPTPPPKSSPIPPQAAPSGNDPVSILTVRVDQFRKAVEVSEGSKKKRMERQLKSIETMLKKAQRGVAVSLEDIPSPPAGIGLNTKPENKAEGQVKTTTPTSQSPVAVEPPKVDEKTPPPPVPARQESDPRSEKLAKLAKEADHYKALALAAKKNGDKDTAVQNLTKYKAIQAAISAGNADFDINNAPPAPKSEVSAPQVSQPPQVVPQPQEVQKPQAKTPLEALLQRRAQFDETATKAKNDGNSSKARRYGRIIKQYDQAIKDLKSGGQPDLSALPDLPNMAPIPGYAKKELTLEDAMNAANAPADEESPSPKKSPPKVPTKSPPKPPPQLAHQLSHEEMPQLPGAAKAGTDGTSKYQQQLEFLTNRHAQFKKAALEAKTKGDKETAMKHLRSMKGMEKMIESAKKGLPVDIRQLPPPPEAAPVVEMSRPELERQDSTGLSARLLNDLAQQVKRARSLSTQFTQLGNVEKAAMMEKWAVQAQRDCDIVKMASKRGDPLPRVTYERRNVQLIKRYNDLRENECEITIKRVLELGDEQNHTCFVQVDFPYPKEKPQQLKTQTFKGANSPAVNFKSKVEISRRHNTFKRAVKNKAIKFVLCQKGGIFSSDKIIGQVAVPLANLEQKCEFHAAPAFMDGRKPLGTKIEVLVRLSEPFEAVEIVNEEVNWATLEIKHGAQVKVETQPKTQNNVTVRSMSIIAIDMKQAEQHCELAKRKQDQNAYNQWLSRRKKLGTEMELTKQYIGKSQQNRNQYILSLKVQLGEINELLKGNIQSGSRTKAADYLKRKKAIESELQKFSATRTQYM